MKLKFSFKLFFILLIVNIFLLMPVLGIYRARAESIDLTGMGGIDPNSIKTSDKLGLKATVTQTAKNLASWVKEWYKQAEDFAWKKAGSAAFWSALRTAMNTVAYDTATWLGSGGKGQKPLFITEGWGEYLTNVADNAAGTFIEQMAGRNFNLCNPDLQLRLRIGLGLVRVERPEKPRCSFTQMKENWEAELSQGDFLNKFQTMFDPYGNDFIQVLTLHTGFMADKDAAAEAGLRDRNETGGWLDVTGLISGDRTAPPGEAERRRNFASNVQGIQFAQTTENPFEDAINVFLNQLAVTLFNRMMEKLGQGKKTTSPYSGDYGLSGSGLTDYYSGSNVGGIAAAKEKFRKLVEPDFNIRGDYNILGELTTCPKPTKAGPTNCVITNKFRKAVEDRLTVGEAMNQGFLNPGGIFGFTSDGLEPNYNEGYPYRSMIILRKFRILPVGWELAAQYIKDHPGDPSLGGTNGARNLEDLVNCYEADDDYGSAADTRSWCAGLVDPNWVLKAPLNYCKREGPGPELLIETVVGSGDDSELTVNRNDKYCADEQTCINEDYDGSCQSYGYCTEERRRWSFGSKTCNPVYNSCETFRGEGGITASYLKNTLNYGNCNADNAGCKEYCQDYDANAGIFTCTPSAGSKLFLDGDSEECDADTEGCHEFIRALPGQGTNFFNNSSFEDPAAGFDQRCDQDAAFGSCSVHLPANYGPAAVPIFLSSPMSLANEVLTFSIYAKGCGEGGTINIGSNNNWAVNHSSAPLATSGNWRSFSVSHVFTGGDQVLISIEGTTDVGGDSCRIDAIKVERGPAATAYSDYRANGVSYFKLIPEYMAQECYVNPGVDHSLRSDAPALCGEFTRLCNQSEVGCKLFTSAKGGLTIPARISAADYCPAECVGYDDYLQSATSFDDLKPSFLIPQTAKRCGAASVGCDEFTNLDTIGQGGESKEYYTYLKQCVRPNDPGANCANFYTWEGSSETGYQLKAHLFQAAGAEPDVTSPDGTECNLTIYNLPPTDPGYNPDCREYYNQSGQLSYHLFSRTITCGEDCHPYRRTEQNIVRDPVTGADIGAAACAALDPDPNSMHYDAVQQECVYCKNGGTWRNDHGACIYMAIPGEGRKCSASQASCREYTGSTGSNIRVIAASDFEGSAQGWRGTGGATVVTDSESLFVGGESLSVSGPAPVGTSLNLGNLINEGKSYNIRFIAKQNAGGGSPATQFNSIVISNSSNASSFTSDPLLSLTLTPEWRLYELDLTAVDHAVAADESLVITANGNFFIDDIRLTEIVDRYYLLKNSRNIPDSCFNDINGNPAGELHNLGCGTWSDKEGLTYYLRRFTQLCDQSAVNCELAIDTHNSTDFGATFWNDGGDGVCDPADGEDCESILADSFVYLVADPEKECGPAGKGCSRLGLPHEFSGQAVYDEIFRKNDPDEYDRILCDENTAGCEAWAAKDGVEYFKDPGDQTCEWKQGAGLGASELSWGWYQKQVSRCDDGSDPLSAVNGEIDATSTAGFFQPLENRLCLKAADCGSNGLACSENADCGSFMTCEAGQCRYSCIQDRNDYLCTSAASPIKTIGYGGNGNIVNQPTIDTYGFWAGLCSADQAGCSEYVDPRSDFNTNEIYNGDFSQDVDLDGTADGWQISTGNQEIDLDPNTLYILTVEGANSVTVTARDGDGNPITVFYVLADNNRFQTPVSTLSLGSTAGERASLRFFTEYGVSRTDTDIIADAGNAAVNNGTKVIINKAVVSYQLKRDLNRTDCNGVINYEEGCVLFNERAITGGDNIDVNYAALVFDADNSPVPENGNPRNCGLDSCDANAILKVKPDRVCNEWLSCRSYIKDRKGANVCFGTGLCDSLDDNGDCDNFIISRQENQTYTGSADADLYANTTGYSKVGYIGGSEEADYFPFGAMAQEGEVIYLNNGNFEISGNNGYPIGWNLSRSDLVWSADFFRVIDNPVAAQNEGVGFSPEGSSFLKAGKGYAIESDLIEAMSGLHYIISAMIDTQNLSTQSADITIEQYNAEGVLLESAVGLSLEYGHPWTFLNQRFQVQSTAQRIRLVLSTTGDGNYYMDDIKLSPALFAQTGKWVPQTCRLYPENESLSCDYIEDTGIRKKGFWGYCLEYDRYPGSAENCVTWWPVDRVKGDGVSDEDIYSGYSGKFPVYYCDNVRADFILVEHREERLLRTIRQSGLTLLGNIAGILLVGIPGEVFFPDEEEMEGAANVCPAEDEGIQNGGYRIRITRHSGGNAFRRRVTIRYYCTPIEDHLVTGMWYRYNGNLVKFNGLDNGGWDETRDGVRIYDTGVDSAPFDPRNYNLTCQKIWQTVNATGQNKAWTARVNTGSPYEIAELRYRYDTDDTPYGSAVPPAPVNNPYEWDSDGDQGGLQPLYMLGESTDAARAGAPYDCVGSQCGHLGLCDISGDVCYNVPVNRPTGVINYCPNDDTNPCYENWQQTFLTCPAGERCNQDLFNVELATIDPHQKLRRIFAQSYGVWEWQGTEGHCAANSATDCSYDMNQCPNGACQARCVMYRESGTYDTPMYNVNASGVSVNYRNCVNGQIATTDPCNDILFEGQTAAQLSTANACSAFNTVCGAGGVNCIASDCCEVCCGDGNADGTDDCGADCCTALERQTCVNYWTLPSPNGVAGQALCNETHDTCNSNADCAYYTTCEWDTCVGGDNVGGQCNDRQICLNDYCVLASTRAGRYSAVPMGTGEVTFWDPPINTCKSAGGNDWARPVWDLNPSTQEGECNDGDCFQCPGTTLGSEHCDFCGVKPRIENITVDNNPGNPPFPAIHGNGFVNLTFNSIVDADQLPLVMYAVDWGDNEGTVVSGVEMRDRKNWENPHSLFHLYSYWDLRAKRVMNYGAGQNTVYCGAANALARNYENVSSGFICPSQSDCCVVRPSLKVKDNWGWCNNGTDGFPCPGGTAQGYQLYGDWDTDGFSNAWIVVTER
ncbi:hypothetical protein A2303_02300 [Candidatus Falkowbacteria bacterium RIFOXYB2_FULL_47_14]|uniref:CBM-cenC domain-containing protein n=1 Tax=Candidatus Falkowbacteria bacterium RIFOXYA2_FULL_47_19 TaxID=1797994 RepID=A0A1F5SEL1_9BACT|nr:MAG: hypothetical protein A2227_07475 [Candidatus Falkowbacteria bacterium RIFOXYA2_FULL_47_19]OGF35252.1 MAG: hypothetical protein A2468_01110 [Candidatus Falkowbacteria bacterium RIFOXYC2_FULL_46_15]OGF43894.1 MAG: hypothetical protein A2303_02300 [Candidatus Falkowbacteria bacterium RIFOXYB2_FULL_47_14]